MTARLKYELSPEQIIRYAVHAYKDPDVRDAVRKLQKMDELVYQEIEDISSYLSGYSQKFSMKNEEYKGKSGPLYFGHILIDKFMRGEIRDIDSEESYKFLEQNYTKYWGEIK